MEEEQGLKRAGGTGQVEEEGWKEDGWKERGWKMCGCQARKTRSIHIHTYAHTKHAKDHTHLDTPRHTYTYLHIPTHTYTIICTRRHLTSTLTLSLALAPVGVEEVGLTSNMTRHLVDVVWSLR